jgi:hypothetical protein
MSRKFLAIVARVGRLGPGLLMIASGCGFILDVESAESSGPCSDTSGCPTGLVCFDGTCRNHCNTDRDCRNGLECIEADGGPTCTIAMLTDAGRESSDVGVAVPEASVAAHTMDAEASAGDTLDGNSCVGCDPLTPACIDGACPQLRWSSPESNYAEPQPVQPDERFYVGLDPNRLYAQRIEVDNGGYLVKLGMLASTAQKPYPFRLALYDDDGGYPLHPFVTPPVQLIGDDGQGTGRQEVLVSPAVHLDRGTYWIAFVSQGSALVLQSTGAQIATAEWTVPATGNPWLDPFPSDSEPPMARMDDALDIYAVVALDP